ncbi:MAG: rod shape-determining protein [Lachnospiraceae bacterium]|nr:rod shape-determining protein [Lachnospiraceae bacterium]
MESRSTNKSKQIKKIYPEPLVFGLDIGTRSIVGTVGYKDQKKFNIVAQKVRLHDTRSMIDGQIHDIKKVGEDIIEVKTALEAQLGGRKLKEVSIAAAGRVLKTSIGKGYHEFSENTVVTEEYIHSLEMLGVEKAYEQIVADNKTDVKYFCVGYTVVKYYQNGLEILNLEGHKANNIGADVLATFLPEEVVDGLYAAVEIAGLDVVNLTLEPIAAMNVAIPPEYRLLNIGLLDVGAGTSDICITKEGSIVAYGMIPAAGDEITEAILKKYLVDFETAEKIKMIGGRKSLAYKDIMGIAHQITPKEVADTVKPVVDSITKSIAEKIVELNGGKGINALFVVGGGGKLPGFTDILAKHMKLPKERVALRGEEVMGNINLLADGLKKDPLYVTPVGICLNFYEQKNNFIYVNVNGDRIKLYDNDKLTLFDAAVACGIPNDKIFAKRGADITFTVDGKQRIVRGKTGEPAELKLNGKPASMTSPIQANDQIVIIPSTAGEDATFSLSSLTEMKKTLTFVVNDKELKCPGYVHVNGEVATEYYEVKDGDVIEVCPYYTVAELFKFMDFTPGSKVYVNNEEADEDTKIFENFKVKFSLTPEFSELAVSSAEEMEEALSSKQKKKKKQKNKDEEKSDEKKEANIEDDTDSKEDISEDLSASESHGFSAVEMYSQNLRDREEFSTTINVIVNNCPVTLEGKGSYVFVDIFDFYEFDLNTVKGEKLIMKINGEEAEHFSPVKEADKLEIYWKK